MTTQITPPSRLNGETPPSASRKRRWPWVLGSIAVVLAVLTAIFDWNWFRGPLERYLTESSGRQVTIGVLDVELARAPRIVLTDIAIDNAPWAGDAPLVVLRKLVLSVSVPSLFTDHIVLPHLGLTDGQLNLVRDKDGRANWKLRKPDEPETRTFEVRSLALNNAKLSLRDAVQNIEVDATGVSRVDGPYEARVTLSGRWRGKTFEGTADTGNVLALRESSEPFPIRLSLRVGQTSIKAEGQVGDVWSLKRIDAKLSVSGPSLATLYPTLPLALPDTPPYRITGRLIRDGDVYTYESFNGVIGSTDLSGDARYELRQPRPMLTATLKSRSLDLADLGPLVGLPRRQDASATAARVRVRASQRRPNCRPARFFQTMTSISKNSTRWTPMCV